MIAVDIVTPHRRLVEGAQVNSLKLPSVKGELTILQGHAELLTLLDTGVLSFASDGEERRFALSYGFAEVKNDKVTIMAETAEEGREIDKNRAMEAQARAETALKETLSEEEFQKQRLKLQRAILRQRVAASA